MKNFNKKQGFTLVELLVVIAIVGILSTLVLVAVQAARGKAKEAKAKHDIDQIVTAIRLLENDTDKWPGHLEVGIMCRDLPGGCPGGNEICGDDCSYNLASGFAGLTQDDGSSPYSGWNGLYMARIPNDPWDNEYFFDTDYDHSEYGWVIVVGSYGPNGIGNNQYDDDDILKIIY